MTATLGPTEARFILESVAFPALRFEHGVTRRVIAALPREHMEFRPAEGARSAGELARHIVGAELRFLEGAASGAFPDGDPDWATTADGAALAELYGARFAPLIERLTATQGDALLRVIDYKGFVKLPALGFVQLAINHTIHHRGQFSVYLRSLGIPVPSIYG